MLNLLLAAYITASPSPSKPTPTPVPVASTTASKDPPGWHPIVDLPCRPPIKVVQIINLFLNGEDRHYNTTVICSDGRAYAWQ